MHAWAHGVSIMKYQLLKQIRPWCDRCDIIKETAFKIPWEVSLPLYVATSSSPTCGARRKNENVWNLNSALCCYNALVPGRTDMCDECHDDTSRLTWDKHELLRGTCLTSHARYKSVSGLTPRGSKEPDCASSVFMMRPNDFSSCRTRKPLETQWKTRVSTWPWLFRMVLVILQFHSRVNLELS